MTEQTWFFQDGCSSDGEKMTPAHHHGCHKIQALLCFLEGNQEKVILLCFDRNARGMSCLGELKVFSFLSHFLESISP